jgi:RNA polymerase sigma-70 factor (ECF subfamily)
VDEPLVRRFALSCTAGDFAALRKTLAEDAIAVTDGGGKVLAPRQPIEGADEVARFVSTLLAHRPGAHLTAEPVNGRTGLVLRQTGQAVAVISLTITGLCITAVWIILNPDKLTHWHLAPSGGQ